MSNKFETACTHYEAKGGENIVATIMVKQARLVLLLSAFLVGTSAFEHYFSNGAATLLEHKRRSESPPEEKAVPHEKRELQGAAAPAPEPPSAAAGIIAIVQVC